MTHRENTEWLKKGGNETGELKVQDEIHIEIKKVRTHIRKIPNWKSPRPDGLQGYWVKTLSNLHNSIAFNWIDVSKKISCLNGWLQEKIFFV